MAAAAGSRCRPGDDMAIRLNPRAREGRAALRRALRSALPALALLAPPLALDAQVGVVIHGRVEDAVSESPIAGALVRSADSTSVAVSDSLGTFAIELGRGAPLLLVAEQFGYLPTEFVLAETAPSRVSVLRLPPVAIELEGVTVVGESDLEAMVHSLTARRNAFAAPSRVMDREALERFGAGDAFDLVVRQVVNVRDCMTDSHPDAATVFLCRYARGSTERLLVCLDGVELVAAGATLRGIPVESIAMAEFYGYRSGVGTYSGGLAFGGGDGIGIRVPVNGQARIYTREWVVSRAGSRATSLLSLEFDGC